MLKLRFDRYINAITGCKENHFYSSGKLRLTFTIAQTSFQLAPKTFWWADWFQSSSVIWIPPKTSLARIARSTSPGLSDTTFFTRCIITRALSMKYSICNIHLLPKAADLRKEAFDEFPLPLNMAIVLHGRLPVHSSFPGSLYRVACYVLCGSTRISVIEN